MSSALWSPSFAPLMAGAVAAAVHHAWNQPEPKRTAAFHEALRKAVGPDEYERIQFVAHSIWLLQPAPPEGLEIPPEWAWFELCPRCISLRRTKYTQPQNGRTKLQVLRDKDWLAEQLAAGHRVKQIAKRLDCSPELVVDWIAKHGLKTAKTLRHEEIEATVRRMHAAGEGPGTIGKALGGGLRADRVREVLKRLGLANQKHGQVYHEAEWWRVRLVDRGLTKSACAREAGIKPHAATYYIHKFGFEAITAQNNRKGRPRRYPELYDEMRLRALLARHGDNYEEAARAIGCAPSLVSKQARRLLGWEKRHENQVPHGRREWWTERLDRGMTTYELAEEAGIEEKTARERCRVFDLLPQAYANNVKQERKNRRAREVA